MTCKDCVHYDVCEYHITEETPMTIAECEHFKNKADFVEVKHGHWIENRSERTCSRCGYGYITCDVPDGKYCCECGAKMDGERR